MKELYRKYRELIVYFIVGCMTTLVNWGVYAAGVELLHWSVAVSNTVSWIAAVAFAADKIAAVPLLVRFGMDWKFMGVRGMWAKILVSVVVLVLNYVFSKLIVFKEKK